MAENKTLEHLPEVRAAVAALSPVDRELLEAVQTSPFKLTAPEQFKEFAANIDYFVFEPNIHDLNDLGWRYLAQHMDMLVAMLGFIPIFIPLMAVLCPLIGGIPYMLYVTKAKKFGMTAIMGFLIGLIMVFFGNGYLTMVTGLVGGLLADVILKKADYKSAKSTVLSCGVFSIWVFGNFAPIFLNRESYMVMLTEGYGAEYAATLNTYMPMWIAPILLVACFVFGLVGGVIGKAICKKHFQRAGIA